MRLHRQRGTTLVSLMVGVTISMVTTVGALQVFKAVTLTAAQSQRAASADGVYLSASMAAGMLLQDAGYGLGPAALGTNVVVLSGASLSNSNVLTGTAVTGTTRSGNAMVWELQPGGTRQCAGLLAHANGGLQRLAPMTCTGASAWATLAWTPVALAPAPVSSDNDRVVPVVFSIAVKNQDCKSFGLTPVTGKGVMTLASTNSNGIALRMDHCLINFTVL